MTAAAGGRLGVIGCSSLMVIWDAWERRKHQASSLNLTTEATPQVVESPAVGNRGVALDARTACNREGVRQSRPPSAPSTLRSQMGRSRIGSGFGAPCDVRGHRA